MVLKQKDSKMSQPYAIALLILLYACQGIPIGLVFGTINILLKKFLSYSELAIFSLASYPYSLKLFWSPLVDAFYFKGKRRRSWIVPIQVIMGVLLYFTSFEIDNMIPTDNFKDHEGFNINTFTAFWFFVIFLAATQDIAVDALALTILDEENKSYASTCQTIGINIGYFTSFTIFMALNSVPFSKGYIYYYLYDKSNIPNDPILTLGQYIYGCSILYILSGFALMFVKEPDTEEKMSVKAIYSEMLEICKVKHIKQFIIFLLLSKIAFICQDTITALKLMDKGFKQEDLALAVLIDFPIQMVLGVLIAKWSSGDLPLRPWKLSYVGRLFMAFIIPLFVFYIPVEESLSHSTFILVIFCTILSSFFSNSQFISISAFISQVADPRIGGTYTTLLNTFSNLGGTWPKFFVLELVDYFSNKQCTVDNKVIGQCIKQLDMEHCKHKQGICSTVVDGYYSVAMVSVGIGLTLYFIFIKSHVEYIQTVDKQDWRMHKGKKNK